MMPMILVVVESYVYSPFGRYVSQTGDAVVGDAVVGTAVVGDAVVGDAAVGAAVMLLQLPEDGGAPPPHAQQAI